MFQKKSGKNLFLSFVYLGAVTIFLSSGLQASEKADGRTAEEASFASKLSRKIFSTFFAPWFDPISHQPEKKKSVRDTPPDSDWETAGTDEGDSRKSAHLTAKTDSDTIARDPKRRPLASRQWGNGGE